MEPKKSIIDAINNPLGFFVLALLIIESFLGSVLSLSNIEKSSIPTFIWVGCISFAGVVIVVVFLVWFKPENLIYDKYSHLVNNGKITFGSNSELIDPNKRFENPKEQME